MSEQGSGRCYRCQTALETRGAVGRRATCPACAADIRCCRNCAHHDQAYHNQCRETQAEPQVDKERGNFCDVFQMGNATAGRTPAARSAARERLDALFAKTSPSKKGAGGM